MTYISCGFGFNLNHNHYLTLILNHEVIYSFLEGVVPEMNVDKNKQVRAVIVT